ncbi:MAG: DUF333 domain-containing protein [Candidatus Sericytochromatia bacterium]|nr:DUF333 domain-containing protein [Candidatus Sericytochromatia bacterium]
MKKKILILAISLFSFGCTNIQKDKIVIPNPSNSSGAIANPASQFCINNGGKLDIRTDSTGSQNGVCIFEDKSECDEWDFYNGKCKKGQFKKP